MPLVVRLCTCLLVTALQIGAPELGFLCSSISLQLHAFSILAANCCCLESMLTGASVSPDCLVSVPHEVVDSAPQMVLAC